MAEHATSVTYSDGEDVVEDGRVTPLLGYADCEALLINLSVVTALILSTFLGLFFGLTEGELTAGDFDKLLLSNAEFRTYVVTELTTPPSTFPTLPGGLLPIMGATAFNALHAACNRTGAANCLVSRWARWAPPSDWWVAVRVAQASFPGWKLRAFSEAKNPWPDTSPWGNSRAMHFFSCWCVAINAVALFGSVTALGSMHLIDARPGDDSDAMAAFKADKYLMWTKVALPFTGVIFIIMLIGIIIGFTVTVWVAYIRFPQHTVATGVDNVVNYGFFIPMASVMIVVPLVLSIYVRHMRRQEEHRQEAGSAEAPARDHARGSQTPAQGDLGQASQGRGHGGLCSVPQTTWHICESR
jgi:uncharacterized membrane protein